MFESISVIEHARDIIHDGQAHQRKIQGILKDTMSDDTIVFYNQLETHALLLWLTAGVLEATDPKDSIYALLGISGLPIEPDYTSGKSVADVYLGFLGLWENCCRSLHPFYPDNVKSGILDLWFLVFAGAESHYKAKPALGLPSWAPNFPAMSARYESGWSYSTSAMNQFPIGEGIVDGINEMWHIDRHSLYCPAVEIDRVHDCGPVIDVLDASLVSWILECVTRQPQYPTGYHSAIAMRRALVDQYLDEDSDHLVLPTPREAYEFIRVLIIWDRRFGNASADLKSAAARIAPLVRSLLLGLDLDDEYSTFWERLPGWVEDGETDETDSPSGTALSHDVERMNATRDSLKLALSTSGGDRLAQTQGGYIGRFPAHVRGGDSIYLLKGYDSPVVLRKVEDHHVVVGSSFIVEPLGGHTREMEALKAGVEVIEMR